MKITGGSFGVTGKLSIENNSVLRISAAINASKHKEEIIAVEASTAKERKFGALSFVIGAPIFAFIGWMLLSGLGVVIGVILAIAGSFYQTKTLMANVEFKDGSKLTVEGWHYEIQRLISLKAQ